MLIIADQGNYMSVADHTNTGENQNRLSSFEYFIYKCFEQDEMFVSRLNNPLGLALNLDG